MDQVFDDILVSIAKANKERGALRKELDLQNTVKYQLLEVGAEAFHIVKHILLGMASLPVLTSWLNDLSFIFNIVIRQHQRRVTPPPPPTPTPQPNAELSELLLELSKLREEMSALAKTQQQKTPPPKQADYSYSKQQQHKPLPFSADMLVSQRKTARPVSKAARPPPPSSNSNSIQDMLQRAIQEKFKNAVHNKPHHRNSNYSSSEDDEDEEETPSFIQEKAQMEEECERATKRPPMPNRFSKRAGKKSPLKATTNFNNL